MTVGELMAQRAAVGARYADLVRELIKARIELMALGHVLGSPIGGGHYDPGFAGDIRELPRLLSHSLFSPYGSRQLSAEVNARVTQLAESLSTAAA